MQTSCLLYFGAPFDCRRVLERDTSEIHRKTLVRVVLLLVKASWEPFRRCRSEEHREISGCIAAETVLLDQGSLDA